MTRNRTKYFTPIGIDVKDAAVVAVQYLVDHGIPSLHAAAMQRLVPNADPDERDAALRSALRSVIESQSFVGRRSVSAMARGDVEIRRLQLGASIEPDDGEIFEDELRNRARVTLLYDIDDAVLDYTPIGSHNEDGETFFTVLLIAAPKTSVRRHLNLFGATGLNCSHLDVAPCAAARVYRDDRSTYALIDLDFESTVISVAQGEDLLFSRRLKFGMQSAIDSLAASMEIAPRDAAKMIRRYGIESSASIRCDLDDATANGKVNPEVIQATLFEICSPFFERLAGEVKRSIEYVSHQNHALFGRGPWIGGEVEQAILFGTLVPNRIEGFLSDRLDLPFSIAAPFGEGESAIEAVSANPSAFLVAAGLALREEAA